MKYLLLAGALLCVVANAIGQGAPDGCSDFHCFACHHKTELGCWISGQYRKCSADSMCGYKTSTALSGRTSHTRGCVPAAECVAANAVEQASCQGGDCLTCDNYGILSPTPPQRETSRCSKPIFGSCSCKGDPHCSGFDDTPFELVGECLTTMASDGCSGGPVTYQVYVQLTEMGPGKVSVTEVKIEAGQDMITLSNNKTHVRIGLDTYVDLGTTTEVTPHDTGSNKISLLSDGAAMRVVLSNEVEVVWDFDHVVSVNVPNDHEGGTCGPCGNYNGDSSDDLVYGPNTSACPGLSGKSTGSQIDDGDSAAFTASWVPGAANCQAEC